MYLCYDASVRLSVTEVHWRIIANLGFKFRSHFTVHFGRRAACGRIISSHATMLASAILSCLSLQRASHFVQKYLQAQECFADHILNGQCKLSIFTTKCTSDRVIALKQQKSK